MTDDEVLEAAAVAARQHDVLEDPRWPSFADGSLGEAESAALVALAQQTDAGRRALELYRPISAAEQATFVDRILAPAPSPARIPVLAPRSSRRGVAMAFSGVALAAGITLLLVLPGRGAFSPLPSPLPDYSITLLGEQTERGPAMATPLPVFGPGSEIDLVLRPDTATTGAIAARAFIVRGGVVEAWTPPMEISSSGSVRIAGSFEAVFRGIPPGPVELALAVGRPGSIPDDMSVVSPASAGASAPGERAWRLVSIRAQIIDRAASPKR